MEDSARFTLGNTVRNGFILPGFVVLGPTGQSPIFDPRPSYCSETKANTRKADAYRIHILKQQLFFCHEKVMNSSLLSRSFVLIAEKNYLSSLGW